MAYAPKHAMKGTAIGQVLVAGVFATDGSGDPTAATANGIGWTASRTGVGTYRITLDKPYVSLDTAFMINLDATASTIKCQYKAEDVNGATPYVDFITTNQSTSTTATTQLLALGLAPHQAAVAGVVTANATDTATGYALANAIATYVAAHDDLVTCHVAADTGTCDVAAAAATTYATYVTLATELIGDWLTHVANGVGGTIHSGVDMYAQRLLPYVGNLTTSRVAGQVTLTNPIAAELISVVADVLMANGAQVIAAQPDYARHLQIRITDGDSSVSAGTVTVIGVGAAGDALTEVHNLAGGTRTIVSTYAYAQVTSVTIAAIAGNGAGDNIGVGVGAALGMPVPIGAIDFQIEKTIVDSANEAVAGEDAVAMSVSPTTAANAAHDYQFHYSYIPPQAIARVNSAMNALKNAINDSVRGPISSFAGVTGNAVGNVVSEQLAFVLVLNDSSTRSAP